MVSSEKRHIKDNERSGEKLGQRRNTRIQCVGVDNSAVVKDIVHKRETAEQKQDLRGVGHGIVGDPDEIAAQQQIDRNNNESIADLTNQRRAGQRRERQIEPSGKLAAKVSGAYADHGQAKLLFQSKNEDKNQGKMNEQWIKLFCCIDSPSQPEKALDQQEQRTQGENKPLLPLGTPASGNVGAEKQAVDQNQAIIKNAK